MPLKNHPSGFSSIMAVIGHRKSPHHSIELGIPSLAN